MKHIGLLLHFYQPPTQDPGIVRKICEECYQPLFSMLKDVGSEVTVNMNLSLTEQLAALEPATLKTVSELTSCSFTSSGAYHPIFPLIPSGEVKRQLELNDSGNRRYLGDVYTPSGVFPPEMAVNPETIKLLGSLGCRWTITDDVPWVYKHGEVPSSWIPSVQGTAVFLRSNFWSNQISFHGLDGSCMAEKMVRDLYQWSGKDDGYVILAMDGETFGHHRPDAIESFLRPFLEEISILQNIRISSLDRILEAFPLKESDVPAGSWSTTFTDMENQEPFPLWNHSENTDHRTYRELMNFVLENTALEHVSGVADEVDKMLYSCPLWWASPGRESFSQVRRGILKIIEAALAGIPRGKLLDRVMELAGRIPAMAGRDR